MGGTKIPIDAGDHPISDVTVYESHCAIVRRRIPISVKGSLGFVLYFPAGYYDNIQFPTSFMHQFVSLVKIVSLSTTSLLFWMKIQFVLKLKRRATRKCSPSSM
ncbi:hypothetical protein DL93DRAFT_724150 [Clavulina sp. PMI_390]|nr:hypothetical protein DL93DRAFT_724150 [Clavulina sp. PMI_390]